MGKALGIVSADIIALCVYRADGEGRGLTVLHTLIGKVCRGRVAELLPAAVLDEHAVLLCACGRFEGELDRAVKVLRFSDLRRGDIGAGDALGIEVGQVHAVGRRGAHSIAVLLAGYDIGIGIGEL